MERLERLVGAARDLANETGNAGFTVQQVCTQAGMSLKGFYSCFAGKDDLLVALLEEDSRIGAGLLAERVATHDGPEEGLRAYVVGIYELVMLPGATGYARVLVQEHRRLSEQRPDDLRRALAPLVDLLARVIDAPAAGPAGDPLRDARTVFALVLDGIHDATLGHVEPFEHADYLWRFCRNALRGSRHDKETR